ncbi:RNA methyltransferase [Pusillimonas sp.]|uniref:RNA methyltransferase n=1 Tax=Pusillimonas sp. TaxID=3040095 RepID=UPI0037CACC0C
MSTFSSSEGAQIFARIDFIMVQPSHPGNVGAAARAIKTMGFERLSLVAPRYADITRQPEALALASGAVDVLENTKIHPTLDEALGETTLAFALTARPRELGPGVCDIRQAAEAGHAHLQEHGGARVAIVVGTERSGLTNHDISLCQRICHIPANPDYSSLNVAQALQLAAWEMRYALAAGQGLALLPRTEKHSVPAGLEPATNEKTQALIAHWEEAMVAIQFLDPAHPKKLMPRMRHLFTRSGLSNDEVDMLRGVCTAMVRTARRR